MSENWIVFAPTQANFVPKSKDIEAARKVLDPLRNSFETLEIVETKTVELFDCGTNLETVSCPNCQTILDLGWWSDAMSNDYSELGFQLYKVNLPCCGIAETLNALKYEFQQAFGRFGIKLHNFKGDQSLQNTLTDLETVLRCKLTLIRGHL